MTYFTIRPHFSEAIVKSMQKSNNFSSSGKICCYFRRLQFPSSLDNRHISRSYSTSFPVLKKHSQLSIHESVRLEVMALESHEIEEILVSVNADTTYVHDRSELNTLLIKLELEAR